MAETHDNTSETQARNKLDVSTGVQVHGLGVLQRLAPGRLCPLLIVAVLWSGVAVLHSVLTLLAGGTNVVHLAPREYAVPPVPRYADLVCRFWPRSASRLLLSEAPLGWGRRVVSPVGVLVNQGQSTRLGRVVRLCTMGADGATGVPVG